MIVATIKKNNDLDDLYSLLKTSLIALGFSIEERPYFPHITLARNTNYLGKNAVSLKTKVRKGFLFSSKRDASGLFYQPIYSFNLQEKQ
jgi:2'-5' RNA ligase